MFCSECGKKIPDGARFCMECGTRVIPVYPVDNPAPAPDPVPTQESAVPAPVPTQESAAPVPTQASEAPAPAPAPVPAQESAAPAPAPAPAPEPYTTREWHVNDANHPETERIYQAVSEEESQDTQPSRKKGIAIACGVVAAAAVTGFVFRGPLVNFALRTFAPAKTYYAYVEAKNAKEAFGDATAVMDMAQDYMKNGVYSFKADAEIELGEAVLDMAEDYLYSEIGDNDFSWMKKMGLSSAMAMDADGFAGTYGFSLNGTDIASIELRAIIDKDIMYIRIPEYDDRFYFETVELGELEEVFTMLDSMSQNDYSKDIKKLAPKCAKAVFNSVKTVKKQKGKVAAGGIKQNGTALVIDITPELIEDMADNLRDVLSEERDAHADNDQYALMLKQAEMALKDLSHEAGSIREDSLGTWTVTVDGSGHIIGRDFAIGEDGDNGEFYYHAPRKGSQIAISAGANIGGYDYFEITGKGKMSGKKFTGDMVVAVENRDLFTLSADKLQVAGGKPDGSMTFYPERYLSSLMDLDYYNIDLSDYSLGVSYSTSGKAQTVKMDVNYDNQLMMGIKYTQSPADSVKMGKPDDVEGNIEDIEFNGDKLREITGRLEKAGLPDTLASYIKVTIDSVERFY